MSYFVSSCKQKLPNLWHTQGLMHRDVQFNSVILSRITGRGKR